LRFSLDSVEREVVRLWDEEARRSPAARVELLTLVALVTEPGLFERAQNVVTDVARVHPSRTIVVRWGTGGERAITADVALHRGAGGIACGDALVVEATGGARQWLPENIDRLALPDLPVCIWWVGDLPDYDRLFDRMLVDANLVIVNSGEMDLRDLELLSSIVLRSRGRCALSDLTWIRLGPWLELVARFFDDSDARSCLRSIESITIGFSPREGDPDVASTQAGLLFGWIAHALALRPELAVWSRGEGWGDVSFGPVVARFERRSRADVPPGTILRVEIKAGGARFEVHREEDPNVLRWSREVSGASTAPQTLRASIREESTLLIRCLERPKRDALFESSLHTASRIVRPVAPRLSEAPKR
jgi:glucose-6-phosphate dehydrogenase assembly protein OpcA